jgi:Anti-sigma-28 factor, FlgM
MVKSDIEFSYTNLDTRGISQFSIERSQKLECLKREVGEGSYQVDSRKLANKLLKRIMSFSGADPSYGRPLPLS